MSLVERYFPKELYDVLKALESEKEATTMQISEVAGVSHSFLLNILPSLKDEGFVSVVKGADKRKKFVNLTDRGKKLVETLEMYQLALEGKFPLAKAWAKS